METIQVPINKWMDKQNMVHIHHGVIINLKKEGSPETRYNMRKPRGHYAK